MRWGSGAAEIESVRLLGEDGSERYLLATGEDATFEIAVRAERPLEDFVFGVELKTPRGETVWGTNTDLAGKVPRRFSGRAAVRLVCPHLRLAAGEYRADVAIHARDGAPYDYRREALGFTVSAIERGIGVYAPEHAWQFDGEIEWDADPTPRNVGGADDPEGSEAV